MKPTSLVSRRSSLFRAFALAGVSALLVPVAGAATSLYLAFGVDTREESGPGVPNPWNDLIVVRDLHGDHYHSFSTNNGTNPAGHLPMPLTVIPGSGESATLSLGAMNISAFAEARYTIPNTPVGDFRLVLVSLSGVNGSLLDVDFVHDDHTHSMFAGGNEGLHLDEVAEIQFSLPEGAELGRYEAIFKIIDQNGNYLESVTSGGTTRTSNFTIAVDAVPEPSAALLAGAAMTMGLLRRRR